MFGSGDYDANTGPIHLESVDAAGTVTDEATLATEEIWEIRPATGGLIVPHVDPSGGNEATGHFSRLVDGVWHVDLSLSDPLTDATPEHVFTCAETADGLWFAGSAYGAHPATGGAACIWRSTDNGATFAPSLLLDGPSLTGFARFYLLVPIGEEIIAVLSDNTGQGQFRWAGSSWAEEAAPDALLTDYVVGDAAGAPFAIAWDGGKNLASVTSSSPFVLTRTADAAIGSAVAAAVPNINVMDAQVGASGTIYLLDNGDTLYRRHADGTWATPQAISGLGTARCMVVDEAGGYLYFGTLDSHVLRVAIPT